MEQTGVASGTHINSAVGGQVRPLTPVGHYTPGNASNEYYTLGDRLCTSTNAIWRGTGLGGMSRDEHYRQRALRYAGQD